MISLTIYVTLPSINKLERMHWAAKKKLRKQYGQEIFYNTTCEKVVAQGGNPYLPYRPRKMRLSTTIFCKTRRLDEDNAMGSLKILIDAMRDIGLIYRDSPKWLTVDKPIQKLDHENPRVEIEIEELP